MKLEDLMPQPGDINKVTEHINQPPTGADVTKQDTSASANVLNQGEAKEQAQVQADVEAAPEVTDTEYKFEIEYGSHKVTIEPEHGLSYNYKASCTCAWEGRFLTSDQAEAGAKKHISVKFPRRG